MCLLHVPIWSIHVLHRLCENKCVTRWARTLRLEPEGEIQKSRPGRMADHERDPTCLKLGVFRAVDPLPST